MRSTPILLLLLCAYKLAFPQTGECVLVLDTLTRQPIPYASVAYPQGTGGTYTSSTGPFTKPQCSTVTISCVGYYPRQVNLGMSSDTIFLSPEVYSLKEVVVRPGSAKKEVAVGYANKKHEYSHSSSSGGEVAVLIENKENIDGLVKKVILRVDTRKVVKKSTSINFTSIFKLNFYRADEGRRIGSCLGSITLASDRPTRNSTFDVSGLNLPFPQHGIFVGVEWVGKENTENKALHVVTENILEPFIATTFKENSTVYERKKLKSEEWTLVDATSIISLALKRSQGFTPLISVTVKSP